MRDEVTNQDFIKRVQKIQGIINSYEVTLAKGQLIMNELDEKFRAEGLTQKDFTQPPRPVRP